MGHTTILIKRQGEFKGKLKFRLKHLMAADCSQVQDGNFIAVRSTSLVHLRKLKSQQSEMMMVALRVIDATVDSEGTEGVMAWLCSLSQRGSIITS